MARKLQQEGENISMEGLIKGFAVRFVFTLEKGQEKTG